MFVKFEIIKKGGIKDSFREIIRQNRKKHNMWLYGHGNHQIIASCKKNWWNPQQSIFNKNYCKLCLLITNRKIRKRIDQRLSKSLRNKMEEACKVSIRMILRFVL